MKTFKDILEYTVNGKSGMFANLKSLFAAETTHLVGFDETTGKLTGSTEEIATVLNGLVKNFGVVSPSPNARREIANAADLMRTESALNKQIGGDHYKADLIQHVEFAQRNGLHWCEAAATKYIMRHRKKNGRQDIQKAIHYLELLLELEYPQKPSQPTTG